MRRPTVPRPRPPQPALALLAAALVSLTLPLGAATITVDSLADNANPDETCTLREAINAAALDLPYRGCPAGQGRDTVAFAVTGTITLAAELPPLTSSLDLVGPFPGGILEIDGDGLYPILDLAGSAEGIEYTVSGLGLRGGLSGAGGAIRVGAGKRVTLRRVGLFSNRSTGMGGAIYVEGTESGPFTTVVVDGCWLDGNEGVTGGGAIALFGGSAVSVVASTLSRNAATQVGPAAATGGGIRATGTDTRPALLSLSRSTLSGNEAAGFGGGLHLAGSSAEVVDSTITTNRGDADGNGTGGGGGLHLDGSDLTLGNTIVAGNLSGSPASRVENGEQLSDVYYVGLENTVISLGFNLIGSNGFASVLFPAGDPNGDGDAVGTNAAPIDALLGPLVDNGGLTPTHAPPSEGPNPVVDRGSCPGATRDQRGYGDPSSYWRIVDLPTFGGLGDDCDKGAVELGAASIPDRDVFTNGFEDGDTRHWLVPQGTRRLVP